jgi:hypothetical protein
MDELTVLGRAEVIAFPEIGMSEVPARIDTGAKTSSIWASVIREENGVLSVIFLGPKHRSYSGNVYTFTDYDQIPVTNSTGHMQIRYRIKLLIRIGGKSIRASFTLADRSQQVYPVLVGRTVLSGKFIVNVKAGTPLIKEEKLQTEKLRARLFSRKKRKA